MISSELFQYVVRNLLNRKVRSTLTIISILAGIATLFIFISFGWGLYNYVEEISEEMGVDKLLIQPKGFGPVDDTFALKKSDLDVIKKTRGIQRAAGSVFRPVQIETSNDVAYVFGTTLPVDDREDFDLVMEFLTLDIIEGRNLQRGDVSRVVMGYSYTLDNRVFSRRLRLGDRLMVNGERLVVVGFFSEMGNPADDSNIYFTEETFERIFNEKDIYSIIVAKVDNVDDIDNIIERTEKNIRKSRGMEEGREDFEVQSFEELLATFSTVLDLIIGFIVLIALVSVFTSAINTANTMFTSIIERTKEIGILKSIGAKNSFIWLVFLLEASLLGFVAGILGSLLGYLIADYGGKLLSALGYGFLQPYFSVWLFVYSILFATLVGAVSGLIPAYNASKKNPVDSLRYE